MAETTIEETITWEPTKSSEYYESLPLMHKERVKYEEWKKKKKKKETKVPDVVQRITPDDRAFKTKEDLKPTEEAKKIIKEEEKKEKERLAEVAEKEAQRKAELTLSLIHI